MDLEMPKALAAGFHSPAQRARSVTEAWGKQNLFCPSCLSPRLESTRGSFKAVDYFCPGCSSAFQLKSKSSNFGNRVLDGQYDTFINALESDRSPIITLLSYIDIFWGVCYPFRHEMEFSALATEDVGTTEIHRSSRVRDWAKRAPRERGALRAGAVDAGPTQIRRTDRRPPASG